nr:hypothetical protein [Tanacetum cinerariifolium]
MAGYKMEHFRGMTYEKVRPIFEREYKKTLFKPDKDVKEPQKKRVAEETLLQESFKKLKAVEVSGFDSIQDTTTNDQKEMSEEDVQKILEIVPVAEFKVEALQEDASKQERGIEAIDADEDITLVDIETQVDMDVKLQGRIDDDNAATKDANAAKPTVFDDEEVTMTMAQTLIKMKAEKAKLLD